MNNPKSPNLSPGKIVRRTVCNRVDATLVLERGRWQNAFGSNLPSESPKPLLTVKCRDSPGPACGFVLACAGESQVCFEGQNSNMPKPERQQNVLDLLKELRGIEPLKQLFWSELNYQRVNQPLPRRGRTESASKALADDPVLFADGGEDNWIFYSRSSPLRHSEQV